MCVCVWLSGAYTVTQTHTRTHTHTHKYTYKYTCTRIHAHDKIWCASLEFMGSVLCTYAMKLYLLKQDRQATMDIYKYCTDPGLGMKDYHHFQ